MSSLIGHGRETLKTCLYVVHFKNPMAVENQKEQTDCVTVLAKFKQLEKETHKIVYL